MRLGIAAFLLAMGVPSLLHAGTSNSLMDVSPDGRWLLACNNDNGTVTVVDVQKRVAVREIAVGAKPEGVTWIPTSWLYPGVSVQRSLLPVSRYCCVAVGVIENWRVRSSAIH